MVFAKNAECFMLKNANKPQSRKEGGSNTELGSSGQNSNKHAGLSTKEAINTQVEYDEGGQKNKGGQFQNVVFFVRNKKLQKIQKKHSPDLKDINDDYSNVKDVIFRNYIHDLSDVELRAYDVHWNNHYAHDVAEFNPDGCSNDDPSQ